MADLEQTDSLRDLNPVPPRVTLAGREFEIRYEWGCWEGLEDHYGSIRGAMEAARRLTNTGPDGKLLVKDTKKTRDMPVFLWAGLQWLADLDPPEVPPTLRMVRRWMQPRDATTYLLAILDAWAQQFARPQTPVPATRAGSPGAGGGRTTS